jgi:hypothetical protein
VIELVPAHLQLPGREPHRHPEGGGTTVRLRPTARELECLRHDADDGIGSAIECHRSTDDRRVSLKGGLPQAPAQNRDVNARPVFVGSETPAEDWRDVQNREQVCRDPGGLDAEWRARAGQLERNVQIGRDPGKRLLIALDVEEVWWRKREGLSES